MNRVIALAVVLIVITGLILWVASGSGFTFGSDLRFGEPCLFDHAVGADDEFARLGMARFGEPSVALCLHLGRDRVWHRFGLQLSRRGLVGLAARRGRGEPCNAGATLECGGRAAEADDGHFHADADINGTDMRMLVDTGASIVVLSEADAERAGLDPERLDYTMVVSTANGQAMAASVTLDEVRVGSIVRRDVRAAVTRGLSGSLLGMSFFNTLSKFAIESDELVLKD